MKNSLFITTDLSEKSPLFTWAEKNNWEIHAQSLLCFEYVPFQPENLFEVVFFSSIRSFEAFIKGYVSYTGAVSFACIGEQTANKIKALGYPVDFIGQHAAQPEEVGKEFLKWLGERRVFFPLSDRSQRTVAKYIPEALKEEKCVYKTGLITEILPHFNYLVFTSPSNVEAFLTKNSVNPDQQVIAWGNTTHNVLKNKGIDGVVCLKNSTIEELILNLNELTK